MAIDLLRKLFERLAYFPERLGILDANVLEPLPVIRQRLPNQRRFRLELRRPPNDRARNSEELQDEQEVRLKSAFEENAQVRLHFVSVTERAPPDDCNRSVLRMFSPMSGATSQSKAKQG